MHVKEQHGNWHLLVIFEFFSLLFCSTFASHLCLYDVHDWRQWQEKIASTHTHLLNRFYRTSFLLISISLETMSCLMCQFPYFTHALGLLLDKLKSIKFINSLFKVAIDAAIRAQFSFQRKMRIPMKNYKIAIWMATKYWLQELLLSGVTAASPSFIISIHSFIHSFHLRFFGNSCKVIKL